MNTRKGNQKDRILVVLSKAGGWMHTKELSAATGIDSTNISRSLTSLAKEGYIISRQKLGTGIRLKEHKIKTGKEDNGDYEFNHSEQGQPEGADTNPRFVEKLRFLA